MGVEPQTSRAAPPRAGLPERATRLLVKLSMVFGVGVGMWPLADQPGLALAVGAVFQGGALAARRHFGLATTVLFVFACVSYGVVRLILDATAAPFCPPWPSAPC
jgi:hypothetical protein